MKKTIVRELVIIVLLSLVIVLTLRMVIFDFIPNENLLPEAIEYETESIVKETLREIRLSNIKQDTEEILKTYRIEKSDLKGYVSNNNNKTDPFTEIEQKNINNR